MVSILASHAGYRGSSPRIGMLLLHTHARPRDASLSKQSRFTITDSCLVVAQRFYGSPSTTGGVQCGSCKLSSKVLCSRVYFNVNNCLLLLSSLLPNLCILLFPLCSLTLLITLLLLVHSVANLICSGYILINLCIPSIV